MLTGGRQCHVSWHVSSAPWGIYEELGPQHSCLKPVITLHLPGKHGEFRSSSGHGSDRTFFYCNHQGAIATPTGHWTSTFCHSPKDGWLWCLFMLKWVWINPVLQCAEWKGPVLHPLQCCIMTLCYSGDWNIWESGLWKFMDPKSLSNSANVFFFFLLIIYIRGSCWYILGFPLGLPKFSGYRRCANVQVSCQCDSRRQLESVTRVTETLAKLAYSVV